MPSSDRNRSKVATMTTPPTMRQRRSRAQAHEEFPTSAPKRSFSTARSSAPRESSRSTCARRDGSFWRMEPSGCISRPDVAPCGPFSRSTSGYTGSLSPEPRPARVRACAARTAVRSRIQVGIGSRSIPANVLDRGSGPSVLVRRARVASRLSNTGGQNRRIHLYGFEINNAMRDERAEVVVEPR